VCVVCIVAPTFAMNHYTLHLSSIEHFHMTKVHMIRLLALVYTPNGDLVHCMMLMQNTLKSED